MQCTQPNCSEPAAFRYAWPWGQTGACCQGCLPGVQQNAKNLDRELAFSPVGRSERTTDRPPPPGSEELSAEVFELRSQVEGSALRIASLERENEALREKLQAAELDLAQVRSALEEAPIEDPDAGDESKVEGPPLGAAAAAPARP